ncbi:odorant receptor Or1-like [Diachasma alloeum]|uniref:Odorant receptor n=1 Tax=Diachasma alloeum TaxID=454923 RepID=A0A4E0RQA3_9HYME|nr:odorant receptor Or1-like [Diachasma alloeum]THK32954.1 odorant receptor 100 [Diachasma alloeum]
MLPYSFSVLGFWGVWLPPDWSSGWKSRLYYFYTAGMIILVYTNTLSQVIDLLVTYKSLKHFINNAFILLSTIGAGVKAAHCLYIRRRILGIEEKLNTYPCKPQDEEEKAILQHFSRIIKILNIYYIGLYVCTITALTTVSFFRDVPRHQLYYHAWLPFNYSSPGRFWAAYMHQVIAHGFDACMHAAYDTIAPGIMIQACAQFAILDHRFQLLPKLVDRVRDKSALDFPQDEASQRRRVMRFEAKKLAECVQHHLKIFQLTKENNKIFGIMIFLQYSLSSVVICLSVLRLSQVNAFQPALISVILYLICMVSQVFMPCYSGHQITLQSSKVSDAIFSMDWPDLGVATKRSLILIMQRSQKPLQFTTGYIITLSIESFNSLMKLSYSVFNVLHRSPSF